MVGSVVNRYSNVTLSNVVINRLRMADMGGAPVELTAEGLPILEIVPVGPYCFGDIGPCQHISREFTLHGRQAQPDEYRIMVDGLCFDVCLHHDKSSCFSLVVCED